MTRTFSIAVSLLLMLLLQVSFFPAVLSYSLSPHLILVGVVMWVVLGSDDVAFAWAFAGGLLLDAFSPDLFGMQTLLLLVSAAVLILIRDGVVSSKSRWLHVSLSIVGSLIVLLVPLAIRPLMRVFIPEVLVPRYGWVLLALLFGTFVLNVLATIVMKPLFTRLTTLFLYVEKRRATKPFGV
ncbi:MAG: rod shape-determining protein MreD [Candidatus Doudnabacteria bacterium]|nr:rod shape-determining protein MreD [Candidatus Doudnabacteria bacterium]MCA9387943.1 rod shape-determining protein MreD [Candidatus Andersenbacteria bacterium]